MTLGKEAVQRRVWALKLDLEKIVTRDPEAEVAGIAVPVLDALLRACTGAVAGSDPVVQAIDGLVTSNVMAGGSLRAADALLVVHQLALAVGRPPRGGLLFG